MGEVLVAADDLTGANAAAAGLARSGLRAVTVRAAERPDAVAQMVSRFDAVVATTECRHVSPAEAGDRVRRVVRAGWPAALVCNRIDTTLRGNVGATTAALLDEVRSLSGGRVMVLCAPAHPAAGRHTISGRQLLEGRRLEETEVARDARSPVDTSDVVALITRQADLRTQVVALAEVTGDPDALVAVLRQAYDDQVDVVVVDATTVEHLERAATAAAAVAEATGLTWVCTDPGPASAAMATALGLGRSDLGAPLLVVSGSATDLTRAQLGRLATERGAQLHLTPRSGPAVPDVDATTTLIDTALAAAGHGDVVVVATALEEADLASPTAAEAEEIPLALARAVRRTLEGRAVDGVMTTGGDVTAALLDELGAHGLEVTDEVVPLAVAGTLVGGAWDGLLVVTKGGLVGDAGTTVACVDHLRQQADVRRRQVTSAQPRSSY